MARKRLYRFKVVKPIQAATTPTKRDKYSKELQLAMLNNSTARLNYATVLLKKRYFWWLLIGSLLPKLWPLVERLIHYLLQ